MEGDGFGEKIPIPIKYTYAAVKGMCARSPPGEIKGERLKGTFGERILMPM